MNESPLKITPIDQIEDLADGVPVLAVEGTVKYAQELKRSKPDAQHAWTKQFFVLSSGTAEIACSMWDAEGSELAKGEKVHIENTQNKKGVWSGMVKGSYQKDGERKHTLEIRCNQVKITEVNGKPEPKYHDRMTTEGHADEIPLPHDPRYDTPEKADPDWPEAEPKPSATQKYREALVSNGNGGVTEARKHIMQSANLYVLCVAAVEAYCSKSFPVVAQTSEMFQAAVGTLFIEASRAGFVQEMPASPIK